MADPAIGPALRAIHASPDTQWTVDTLARESGLSRAAFARRFSTVLGEPPLTYLTSWRMVPPCWQWRWLTTCSASGS
jgi:AraC-like DNA-binding protein